MWALLKLIPIKDWLYGGVIVVLLAIFSWYTHHERTIGQQRVELQDKALADAQIAKNKEIEDGISEGIKTAVNKWQQDHPAAPPAPVPHLVCYNSSHSSAVSKGRSTHSPSNGTGTAVPVNPEKANGGLNVPDPEVGFDPASAVSAIGTDADTEIVRLKNKVTLLQDIIKAYQNGGLVEGN